METPSNPLLKIVDLAAVAKIVRAPVQFPFCDNTWAPIIQRPFDLGVDLILHSTTKYFGGIATWPAGWSWPRATMIFSNACATSSTPAAPSLTFRLLVDSARNAHVAVAHARTFRKCRQVADALSHHREVERVHYPGLLSHPGHEIARKQMSIFGGMLSFEVKGGRNAAMSAAAKRKSLFARRASAAWKV